MGVNVTGWKVGLTLGVMFAGYVVLGVYLVCSSMYHYIKGRG